MTLSIPQRRDPAARIALIGMACAVIYLAFANVTAPDQARAQADIIIEATPALPTPAQDSPAFAWSVPTPTPAGALVPTAGPGWLDQQLAALADAGDQLAVDQAAQLAAEQEAARIAAEQAAAEQVARDQYLANVGAQAPHTPRSAPPAPPQHTGGPILYPDENVIIQPVEVAPAAPPAQPAIAVAVPAISDDQRAVLAERDSNGCAAGEVFYPRTGCHAPGSGGEMPGAVGAP